jgi:hypothetical protein
LSEELKDQNNCKEPGGDFRIMYGTPLETSFDRCPKSYVTEDIHDVLWLWREWREHKPPVAGGSWDQPQGLTEAFKVLESVAHVLLEEERKKWEHN